MTYGPTCQAMKGRVLPKNIQNLTLVFPLGRLARPSSGLAFVYASAAKTASADILAQLTPDDFACEKTNILAAS